MELDRVWFLSCWCMSFSSFSFNLNSPRKNCLNFKHFISILKARRTKIDPFFLVWTFWARETYTFPERVSTYRGQLAVSVVTPAMTQCQTIINKLRRSAVMGLAAYVTGSPSCTHLFQCLKYDSIKPGCLKNLGKQKTNQWRSNGYDRNTLTDIYYDLFTKVSENNKDLSL